MCVLALLNNNMQLLKESLEEILEYREIEVFLENLDNPETQRKFDSVTNTLRNLKKL
jgi:hypothetical protein